MKLSRTAIKELKARYLDILKKCAYLNAVIIASSLAVNAASATTLGEFARSDGDGVFDMDFWTAGGLAYTVSDADLLDASSTGLGLVGAGNKTIQGSTSGETVNSINYIIDGRCQIIRFFFQFHIPGLKFRKVQNVPDNGHQIPSRQVNIPNIIFYIQWQFFF